MGFGALLLITGCGGDDTGSDAGSRPDATRGCVADDECNDGLHCNGTERCEPEGCVAGSPPCEGTCDEEADDCGSECRVDGDGHADMACGGDDCDDDDPLRYVGATEVCDPAGRDEDCDPSTFGFRDADGDLYADASCCNGERCGTDCDDAFPGAHPGLPEVCDGLDNDCDGSVDEGVQRRFWPDMDGDEFGAAGSVPVTACLPPADHVENDADCDDTNRAIHPLADEVCDAGCLEASGCVDENCDGDVLEPSECECVGTESVSCGARGFVGVCATGTMTCMTGVFGMCSVSPGAEACNGEDDDCDGRADEGLALRRCWVDLDRDTYAPAGAATSESCGVCPVGTTDRRPEAGAIDCRDDRADTYPGAPEVCDGRDQNCDAPTPGGVEPREDADSDGFPPPGGPTGCSDGPLLGRAIDCHPTSANHFPGQPSYFTTAPCPWDPAGFGYTNSRCTPDGENTCIRRDMWDTGEWPYSVLCTHPVDWDYNCSGRIERRFAAETCMNGGCR